MHTLMKTHLTRAAVITTVACSLSYSLSAAADAESVSQKAGNAVGGAERFVGDVAITTAVKTKLVADDMTKARDIKVITDKGVVSLIGDVGSTAEKDEAESVARSVDGVKSVKNELKLKTP